MSLEDLVNKSIYIIREAKNQFKNVAALWSTGKDSTVLLALARQAFLGKIPFPAIHIDNGLDFPETYALRDELSKEWKFKVIVAKSKIMNAEENITGLRCCGANKTEALKEVIEQHKFDGLFVSIRRDEHGIRAKERYFSPRDSNFRWDYLNQPAEVWDYYIKNNNANHTRIHPLLHWTELDIWKYIKQENLPVNPLYFSRNGKRFRSLGCTQCTVSVDSEAKTTDDIIKELGKTNVPERAGRFKGKEDELIMQRLRALGYM